VRRMGLDATRGAVRVPRKIKSSSSCLGKPGGWEGGEIGHASEVGKKEERGGVEWGPSLGAGNGSLGGRRRILVSCRVGSPCLKMVLPEGSGSIAFRSKGESSKGPWVEHNRSTRRQTEK